ncbi:MAG: hypothetical protein JWM98_676, partial [Thermoleophilia bacterium]|nr:hypothetical protein [Thermoleophilia bacterium]
MDTRTRVHGLDRELQALVELTHGTEPFIATVAQFALESDDLEELHSLLGQLYMVAMVGDRADIAEAANDLA